MPSGGTDWPGKDNRPYPREPASRPKELPRLLGKRPGLVLDDDRLMLRFVRDALASAGWAAPATGDLAELGRLIEAERPDLVLLDLVLPGTDGIDLMRKVPDLAELPVIFISGYSVETTRPSPACSNSAPPTTSSSRCRPSTSAR